MNILFNIDEINASISLIAKTMAIAALVVYAIFAVILISQIRIKRNTVTTELGSIIELLGYIHFGLSLILIIVAFFIL